MLPMEHIHVEVDEILFYRYEITVEEGSYPMTTTIHYKHHRKLFEATFRTYRGMQHVSSIIQKGNSYKPSNVIEGIKYIEPKVQCYVYDSPDEKVTVYSNVDPTVKELD